jgi:hypothetical protein
MTTSAEQVRERIRRVLSMWGTKRSREAVESGVMAVVSEILAERDAAQELLNQTTRDLVKADERAERAEASKDHPNGLDTWDF